MEWSTDFNIGIVLGTADTFAYYIDSNTDQGGFVGVHQVRYVTHIQDIGTTSFAKRIDSVIFVQTFVDSNHCNVYTDFTFDLREQKEINYSCQDNVGFFDVANLPLLCTLKHARSVSQDLDTVKNEPRT